MEQQDIKQQILYNIEDIQDIENLCQSDKSFKFLCSQKEFWIHWYKSKNIPFPKHLSTYKEWINEYKNIVNTATTEDLFRYLMYSGVNYLTFKFIADPNDYDYLKVGNESDQKILSFLVKHNHEHIQCFINFDYIFYQSEPGPLLLNAEYINNVVPKQFIMNVLNKGIIISKIYMNRMSLFRDKSYYLY